MNDLEEIKERVDIVDLVGSYITLKKAGRNYKACCPFHKEKTASFMVSPDKQIWHCFGCQKGGDVFGFTMEMEGMEFGEALRFLGKKAGVQIKEFNSQMSDKKSIFFELNNLATSFYHKVLMESSEAKVARDYLEKRGIDKSTILDFKLGYSPNTFTGLTDLLFKKGFKAQDIIDAGLAVKKESGKLADRFFKRLMFPIINQAGSVVGFTARILTDEKIAKYINTPETAIYEKSKALFGVDKAKKDVVQKNWIAIVEGNMDVIASYQAGVRNTVASSGTALTRDQLKIIKRYTQNVILALDRDEAGSEALKRGIFLALEEEMNIKIANLGDFKDPDEMVKKDPILWKKALKESKPFMDFYFAQFFDTMKKPFDITQKKKIARESLSYIKEIKNDIEQNHYLKELSKYLDVPEESLRQTLLKAKEPSKTVEEEKVEAISKKSAGLMVEEALLGLSLRYSSDIKEIISLLEIEDFMHDSTRAIFSEIKKAFDHGNPINEDAIAENKSAVSEIAFVAEESHKESSQDEIFKEAKFCYKRLKEIKLKKEKDLINKKIQQAEKEGNQSETSKLMEKFQEILGIEQKVKEF